MDDQRLMEQIYSSLRIPPARRSFEREGGNPESRIPAL
jgi:hypothetical protein